jgi:hypothetical protein
VALTRTCRELVALCSKFSPDQLSQEILYCAVNEAVANSSFLYSQLAKLSETPPDITQPSTPDWNINGSPAKGICFGLDLRDYPYSAFLIHLIQECLYEHPAHRPTFLKLKERIRDGFIAAIKADPDPEPWAAFSTSPLVPAPAGNANASNENSNANQNAVPGGAQNPGAPQASAAWVAGKTIIQCYHHEPPKKRCGNRFKWDGSRIYCRGPKGHLQHH